MVLLPLYRILIQDGAQLLLLLLRAAVQYHIPRVAKYLPNSWEIASPHFAFDRPLSQLEIRPQLGNPSSGPSTQATEDAHYCPIRRTDGVYEQHRCADTTYYTASVVERESDAQPVQERRESMLNHVTFLGDPRIVA